VTAKRPRKALAPRLMPLRWRELDGRILATNDGGDFVWLDRDDFAALTKGTLDPARPAHKRLSRARMLGSPATEERVAERLRERSHHVFTGPGLHILISPCAATTAASTATPVASRRDAAAST
jgi:hypothetical protein